MKRTFLVILAALMLFSAAGCNSPGAPMSYDSLMRCEKEYGIVEGDWPESFDEMWSSRVSASLASGVVRALSTCSAGARASGALRSMR